MAACTTQCEKKQGFSSDKMLACTGVSALISEAVAAQYVDQVPNPAPGNFAEPTRCYALACVRAGRLIYARKKWSGFTGDCPTDTPKGVQPGPAALASMASGAAGSVAGVAAGLIGTGSSATVAAGGTAATVGAGAGLGAALGIASFGLGLIAIPFAIIGQHAAMVEAEQKTICSAAVGYNSFANWIESELRAGRVGPQDAATKLRSVRQEIADAIAPAYKSCNFACGFLYALDCLVVWNEQANYPALHNVTAQSVNFIKSGPGIAILSGAGLLLLKAVLR